MYGKSCWMTVIMIRHGTPRDLEAFSLEMAPRENASSTRGDKTNIQTVGIIIVASCLISCLASKLSAEIHAQNVHVINLRKSTDNVRTCTHITLSRSSYSWAEHPESLLFVHAHVTMAMQLRVDLLNRTILTLEERDLALKLNMIGPTDIHSIWI